MPLRQWQEIQEVLRGQSLALARLFSHFRLKRRAKWRSAYVFSAPRRKKHIGHAAVTDILGAAEAVFARAGFSGATMAGIAELTGLPKANLHFYFRNELKALVDEKARVIEHWAQKGLMDRIDARHLFFTNWAATQTYADFQPQVCAVLGKSRLTRAELDHATEQLVRMILRGCGVRGCR